MSFEQKAALVAAVLLFNVTGNILIKQGTLHQRSVFFNKYTASGYLLFSLVLLMTLKLVTIIEIKYISFIMAVNCFTAYMAGITVFREQTNRRGIAGICIVCLGIVVFNL